MGAKKCNALSALRFRCALRETLADRQLSEVVICVSCAVLMLQLHSPKCAEYANESPAASIVRPSDGLGYFLPL